MITNVGALSAMTPASTLAALGLVKQGQVYDLGVHLGNTTPHLPPDSIVPFLLTQFRTPSSFANQPAMRGNSFSVELVQGSLHQSSHIDGLIHAQRHGRVFGGQPIEAVFGDRGWRQNGIETVPPIILRAVIIDTVPSVGVMPVPDGQAVTLAQIQAAVAAQGVLIRPGDAVLVRTGKVTQFTTDAEAFQAGCPGIDGPAARWLAEQGMALFGLDTTSADPLPTPNQDDTVHEALLIQRGIHIIENLYLEDLVSAGVRECLFICLPLKIDGATGSWVRPVAIV
jgi:kynurenine formamidase